NENATEEEMINIANKAQCHDFIMKLPQGYDTVLQESGSNLSGGERQRISIARAMLKPSKFVILDEATSSVDPENEKQLLIALKNLLKGKTVIIIAHKLKTIKNADKIIVIDKGKIENIGKHRELIEKSNIYKSFIEKREKATGWKIE
ncbi:ATP-binding cassette domain-containing protein, partial [Anaerococcus porci]|uniref:ATP-binding cassette domain-containing protein n=1 Tax=Anaerococcus porci TaxID=2652269 RepID=UPI002A762038